MSDSPQGVEEFGQYKVHERLGVGGVATVHRAELRGADGQRKHVALKRLMPHLVRSPNIVDSFVREAQLAIHLQHHNIAQTYEAGRVADTYFIAMELVLGPTLQQIMQHSQAVAAPIPIPVALGLLVQICDALDYAHECTDENGKPLDIVHRDVSPPNVIMSNTGTVKLVDFGIAKVQNEDRTSQINLKAPAGGNVIKGRFDYIAPEYLAHGRLDRRADLFALGVIAHELLTGRKLFDGETDFDTSAKVLSMEIKPPSRWTPAVPNRLDRAVMTALERDPGLRFQTARELRDALATTGREVASRAEILHWVDWAFSQKTPVAPGAGPPPVIRATTMSEVEFDFDDDPGTRVATPAAQRRVLEHPEIRPPAPLTLPVTPLPTVAPSSAPPVALPLPAPTDDPGTSAPSLGSRSNPTILGIGDESELMQSSRRFPKLVRPPNPQPAVPQISDSASHPGHSKRFPRPIAPSVIGRRRPGAGPDEDSGVVLVSPPGPERIWQRTLVYVAIVALAAIAGVIVAAYLFGIDLPGLR